MKLEYYDPCLRFRQLYGACKYIKSASMESFALVMVLVDDCRNKVNTQIALLYHN